MRAVFLDFDSLHPADLETDQLEATLDHVTYFGHTAAADIEARLQDAEVAIVNKVQLGAAEIARAKSLRLICLAATGSDNIDLEAAQECNVAVANIRDYCTPSVVQHVFTVVLTLNQKLDAYRFQVNAGNWATSKQFCLLEPTFRELAGKTLGIVGYGTLGSAVANAGAAFGMNIIAAARTADQKSKTSSTEIKRLALDELLAISDVVSLHCPLNAATRHMIDAQALEHMRSDAILVNTARGGLIDSAALVDALNKHQIGGAAIDVLTEEPPLNGDPLLETALPQLIVTPHMAWAAREARQRALDQIRSNIENFVAGIEGNRLV